MPMKFSDIALFENKTQLSITVFNFDEKESLTSCHRSKVKSKIQKVFPLLPADGLNYHYCLITNFQNFMHTLCRSPRKAIKGPKTKFCVNCMKSIGKVKYGDQVRLCEDNQPLRIVMPNEELKLKFNNWEKTQKCPFVVYADLEALNVPAVMKKGKRLFLMKNNIPQATVVFWLIVEPTFWLRNPSIVAKTASANRYEKHQQTDTKIQIFEWCDQLATAKADDWRSKMLHLRWSGSSLPSCSSLSFFRKNHWCSSLQMQSQSKN